MGSRERRMAETREAVLSAARRVFAREGYHGASLDRVAAEAGFTKGAVYASFENKADLLLAIYEQRVAERAVAMEGLAARVRSLDALRESLLRDWREGLERERDWSLLRLEFWAYAARNEPLRARLHAAHVRVRDSIAQALTQVAERTGEQLPLPAADFATCVMALGNGLNLEAVLGEPGTDDLYDWSTRRLGAVVSKETR